MQAWLLPPGLNILIIFLGIVIWLFAPRTGKTIGLIGLISLWLLSMPFVAYKMVGILQDEYPMLEPESLGYVNSNQAIVVLGGGDNVEAEYGNKQTVSDATVHRLNYAAYLNKLTHLPIIVSGGKLLGAVESEADLMADYLLKNDNIIVSSKEDKSMNTADESEYLSAIFKQKQISGAYLVTNAWHMPRSVYIFRCAGIKVTPAPMGYYSYGPGYALISFLPNIDALKVSSIAVHEFVGLMWYHWNYGDRCKSLGSPGL